MELLPITRPARIRSVRTSGALLTFVREGDTVVVHSMDPLAPNLEGLGRLVRELTARRGRIEFVKEGSTVTDEDTPMATLLLSVMGAFAEFERARIHERQQEGIALAKRRGVFRGRKKALSRSGGGREGGGGGAGRRVWHQPRVALPASARCLSPAMRTMRRGSPTSFIRQG